MEHNSARIIYLLKVYQDNLISESELAELLQLSHTREGERLIDEVLENKWSGEHVYPINGAAAANIYGNIISDERFVTIEQPVKVKKLHQVQQILMYAAVLLVICSIGIGAYFITLQPNTIFNHKQQTVLIVPGGKKATLTLGNGSKVTLTDQLSGKITLAGNLHLNHIGGTLSYDKYNPENASDLNIITTPKGGEYQVILQDGTHVWLNADSKISYPVVFNGPERRVQIKGEAYFEVAKNAAKPFIVEANGSEIRVLGTHFNVSAYPDDELIRTTLIEGAVKVWHEGRTALLSPGHEATINRSSADIQLKRVDTEQALAWKNGYFMFNDEDIKSVMKKISRWYDIDIQYQADLKGKTFGGTLSRFGNITQLLNTIELTGDVHFKVRGRRIIVMP